MNPFTQFIDVTQLGGTDGFVVEGINPNYAPGVRSGWSVSGVGDMNGDGIDDFVIGARDQAYGPAGPAPNYASGAVYVVFGDAGGFPASFSPNAFNGLNGFVIAGVRQNLGLGLAVDGVGDFNEDGYDDIVIGTAASNPGTAVPGEAFVLFGRPDGGFPVEVDINQLAVGEGFRIVDPNPSVPGRLGTEVAGIGDYNGDGIDDIAVSEIRAFNPNNTSGGSRGDEGAVHVIFGGAANVPTIPPTGGGTPSHQPWFANYSAPAAPYLPSSLSILGPIEEGGMGTNISGGDFNGDGIDDILTAAPGVLYRTPAAYNVYVSFGQSFAAPNGAGAMDIRSGPGMAINVGTSDMRAANAGDVNGDGFDDILIGVYDTPRHGAGVGLVALVYGAANLGSQPIDIYNLDGTDGIEIIGPGNFGIGLDGVGDVNHDGYADFAIGSAGLTPGGSGNPDIFNAGFILFGGPTGTIGGTAHTNGDFSVNDIDGINGFIASGTSPHSPSNADALGWSVDGAGDVNGDGIDDIVIGAPQATAAPGGVSLVSAGRTYVIYGKDTAANPPADVILTPGVTDPGRYGNRYDGQSEPDGEVTFSFDGGVRNLDLDLRGYDVDYANEVEVLLNGTSLGFLETTPNNGTGPSSFRLALADQVVGQNVITVRQALDNGYVWGVTDVTVSDGPDALLTPGVTDTGRYGHRYDGQSAPDGEVTFAFDGGLHALDLDLQGYDVDYANEVEVLLNGTSLGFLETTPNNGTGPSSFRLALADQVAGENVITVRQALDNGYVWGVTDVRVSVGADATLTPGVTDTARYGNRYAGQSEPDGEVTFAFDGGVEDLDLDLLGYDVDYADEVEVLLNGTSLGFLETTPNNGTGPSSFRLALADQVVGQNVITVRQALDNGYVWGVTDLSISAPPTPDTMLTRGVTDTSAYGNRYAGQSEPDGEVLFGFQGGVDALVFSLRGYDIDYSDEVRVLLNGDELGFLTPGANNGLADSSFTIAAADQVSGLNVLTIEQNIDDGYVWGVTDLLIA